jgi:hypothetical protein
MEYGGNQANDAAGLLPTSWDTPNLLQNWKSQSINSRKLYVNSVHVRGQGLPAQHRHQTLLLGSMAEIERMTQHDHCRQAWPPQSSHKNWENQSINSRKLNVNIVWVQGQGLTQLDINNKCQTVQQLAHLGTLDGK